VVFKRTKRTSSFRTAVSCVYAKSDKRYCLQASSVFHLANLWAVTSIWWIAAWGVYD